MVLWDVSHRNTGAEDARKTTYMPLTARTSRSSSSWMTSFSVPTQTCAHWKGPLVWGWRRMPLTRTSEVSSALGATTYRLCRGTPQELQW